jgi:hypothetical protein
VGLAPLLPHPWKIPGPVSIAILTMGKDRLTWSKGKEKKGMWVGFSTALNCLPLSLKPAPDGKIR